MTHKDIYTKFMIEYDKANVTSSYPSLTEYEAATILDKAYLALIAQKFTGNNVRRVGFEGDIKSISDLEPLIRHADIRLFDNQDKPAINTTCFNLPGDFMYYISAQLNGQLLSTPYDTKTMRLIPIKLVPHSTAEKFFSTPYNMPWVKNPVCYVENGVVNIVYDPIKTPIVNGNDAYAHFSYLKTPNKFVDSVEFTTPQVDTNRLFTLDISKLNQADRLG